MAITRERRTAMAELMTATARLQLVKSAMKDETSSDADLGKLLQTVVDCVERAMAELKS